MVHQGAESPPPLERWENVVFTPFLEIAAMEAALTFAALDMASRLHISQHTARGLCMVRDEDLIDDQVLALAVAMVATPEAAYEAVSA